MKRQLNGSRNWIWRTGVAKARAVASATLIIAARGQPCPCCGAWSCTKKDVHLPAPRVRGLAYNGLTYTASHAMLTHVVRARRSGMQAWAQWTTRPTAEATTRALATSTTRIAIGMSSRGTPRSSTCASIAIEFRTRIASCSRFVASRGPSQSYQEYHMFPTIVCRYNETETTDWAGPSNSAPRPVLAPTLNAEEISRVTLSLR